VVDENTVTDESSQDAAVTPFVRVPPIESRFLFVDIAALRAKQLRRGARVRLPEALPSVEQPHKPERIAMEEVRQGLVEYDLPEPHAKPVAEQK
jgi:DNA-directed RNA polymerase omega subunit